MKLYRVIHLEALSSCKKFLQEVGLRYDIRVSNKDGIPTPVRASWWEQLAQEAEAAPSLQPFSPCCLRPIFECLSRLPYRSGSLIFRIFLPGRHELM